MNRATVICIKDRTATNTSGDTSCCWFFWGFQQLSRPWNTWNTGSAGVFSGLPEADQGPGLLQQLEHSGLLQVTTEAVPLRVPLMCLGKNPWKHDETWTISGYLSFETGMSIMCNLDIVWPTIFNCRVGGVTSKLELLG